MYAFEVRIDGLPKLANSLLRGHWRTRIGHVRLWKRKVHLAVTPYARNAPLTKARLTLKRFSSRECDFDGLVSSFKACIDGLVEAGILADDKPSNIGQSTYLWEKCPPRQGHITIKVEELIIANDTKVTQNSLGGMK